MRILYLDLFNSGISGDMFLASLLGLVPVHSDILKKLENLKEYLPGISNLEIKLVKAEHSGIKLNQLKINVKETKNHRSAKTLQNSLNEFLINSKISNSAKNYANNVLNSLIQAEAEVHGELIEKIHLHELSSVDTLIDILGVVLSLEAINYFNDHIKIFYNSIPLGGGMIETKHGLLAIPAPATLKILEKSDLITFGGPIKSELVTPTGAALLANLNPSFLQYSPKMNILKSIFSTGQKKFKNFLNVFRIFYGESKELDNYSDLTQHLEKYIEKISILETDVDDVTGEILGNFIEKLEKTKVLDIQVFPSITKKNRPGHIIKVLCYPKQTFELIEMIMHELGTLGVRFNVINRVCIDRKIEKRHLEINGKTYEANYKISFIESDKGVEIINIKTEYNDLKKISEESGLSIKKIQLITQAELKQIYYKYKNIKN